ncbi:MAG: hypothetical protein K2G09_00975 [Paramuribaculum sp.]|nr:hypothetical protein [Paramuribaculum sp.]
MKRSVVIPLILLGYLGVMSYLGRGEFFAGNYLFYFGIIGATLVIIWLLHINLKMREKKREERDSDSNQAG